MLQTKTHHNTAQRCPKLSTRATQHRTLNVIFSSCLYFPYLLFGWYRQQKKKKKHGGVSLAWLSLRDFVRRVRGEEDEEEGTHRGSKLFSLCAFSCMLIGPAAPALPQNNTTPEKHTHTHTDTASFINGNLNVFLDIKHFYY